MRGPPPKDPAIRQRTNKVSTKATLSADGGLKRAPSLPGKREFHPMTKAWWKDVWHSPMVSEYLKVDVHGLYRLAILIDRFWIHPSITLSATIAQQEQRYGLSPLDRRRLQWEVEKAEAATRKRQRPRLTEEGVDPRELLRVVK